MKRGDEIIYANWCLSDNFGDKLTPYLVEKISGKKCVYSPHESDLPKYAVAGSILNWEIKNCTAWGVGLASRDDHPKIETIKMVRGEISKYISIVEGNNSDIVVGDPALLLPRYYTPKVEKKYKLGIFPHYIDADILTCNLLNVCPDDVIIIYALDDIEKTIDAIFSCERVISSSLHGLIVADAYRIPSRWVKFSDRILGDGTKYMDYYSSIGYDIGTKPIDLRGEIAIEKMLSVQCDVKELKINFDKMIECCPFKT